MFSRCHCVGFCVHFCAKCHKQCSISLKVIICTHIIWIDEAKHACQLMKNGFERKQITERNAPEARANVSKWCSICVANELLAFRIWWLFALLFAHTNAVSHYVESTAITPKHVKLIRIPGSRRIREIAITESTPYLISSAWRVKYLVNL